MENFNPDAMTEEELNKAERAFTTLASYCYFKSQAIAMRRKGYIDTAMSFEQECDKLYTELPEQYKW